MQPTTKARKLMLEMEDLDQKKKEIDARQKELKEEIEKELEKAETTFFDLDDGEDKVLRALSGEMVRISWDVSKLRDLVSKDVLKMVAKVEIDNKKMEEAHSLGLIRTEKVAPACTKKTSKFLRVQRVNREN